MKLPSSVWTALSAALVLAAFALGYSRDGWGGGLDAAVRALVVVSLVVGAVRSYRTTRRQGKP